MTTFRKLCHVAACRAYSSNSDGWLAFKFAPPIGRRSRKLSMPISKIQPGSGALGANWRSRRTPTTILSFHFHCLGDGDPGLVSIQR